MITLEVQTNDGGIEKWLVSGPAINRLEANGWTKTTVKAGDVITEDRQAREGGDVTLRKCLAAADADLLAVGQHPRIATRLGRSIFSPRSR